MRTARMLEMLGISGFLVLGALGCGKVSRDHSKVVASMDGEKITEKVFQDTVRALVGDDAKAQVLLTSEAAREQRNQFLQQWVTQKALMRLAKREGLEKDPKIRLAVEAATASVYAQALVERSIPKDEPTEAQLKSMYDEYVKQAEAAGQKASVQPYEQMKPQLPAMWKNKEGEQASSALLTQLKQKYPVVFAPDYRPAQAQ
jgi:hypothetical protein